MKRFIEVDGRRLRNLRKERMLSLRDLSSMTGVAHDGISKLESGQRRAHPRTVRRLAEALNVPPMELVNEAKGEDDG